ncbi:unnamed protein product [Rhodiola kirilowii]
MWEAHQAMDVRRHPRYDTYPSQFNPTFPPPPPLPPPPPHHQSVNNYPNFYTNLPPPPPDFQAPPHPPQPDFRFPPPSPQPDFRSPFPFRSPNCTPPIEDSVDFRVSRSHIKNRSICSGEFRLPARGREPSPSFNGGGMYDFHPSVSPRQEVGNYRHQFAGMDFSRPTRYDSAGPSRSDLCRSSSGYGCFVQKSNSPMTSHGAEVHRGWGSKRQRYEHAPRSFEHSDGGFGAPYRRGNTGYPTQGNNQSPNRKVQKKSAFLRLLTAPARSNYDDKKPLSSGHCNSAKTSPFKVKYSSPAKHRITKENDSALREEKPVHVSFKSNSLVAKQIIAPSSPANATDENCNPRERKFRKSDSDDLIFPSDEVKQSAMKPRISGQSLENPSLPDKSNELAEGSDCGLVSRNLSDMYTSPAGQVDSIVEVLFVDGCNPSGSKLTAKHGERKNLSEYEVPLSRQPVGEQSGRVSSQPPTTIINHKVAKRGKRKKPSEYEVPFSRQTVGKHSGRVSSQTPTTTINHKVEKRGKRKKLSEYEVPLSMPPTDEQFGGVSSLPPITATDYKDSKESCWLLPDSLTGTGSVVFNVDDHSHHSLPQHIGASAREFPVKQCFSKQSDNHKSQPLNGCFSQEVVADALAAKVNEMDCSEYPQDKGTLISPPETHLPCNTIVDQSSSEGAIDKGIIGEHTQTVSVDDNNNNDHDIGFGLTNINKRKERGIQFNYSESMPTETAQERDLCNKVIVEFDKDGFISPDQAEMKKEVTCVMDKGLASVDDSHDNFEVTATESEEAAPGSSRSMALHKDGCSDGIFNLACGSSEPASSVDIEVTNREADSDPDVQSTIAFLERMPEGQTTNSYTYLYHKSNDMTLENDKNGVDDSVARIDLGRAMPVDSLPLTNVVTPAHISSVRNMHSLKSSSAKYQKSNALPAPFRASSALCFANPKIKASKLHAIKSRTWHRSVNDSTAPLSGTKSGSNSVPPHSHILKGGKAQGTSYIRKGNSLVRNLSPVNTVPQDSTYAAPQPSFTCFEDKKMSLDENKDYMTLEHIKPGKSDNLHNIQKYEACQLLEKTSSGFSDTSPLMSSDISPMKVIANCCSKSNSAPMRSPDDTGLAQLHDEVKSKGTTENQTVPILGAQTVLDKGISVSSKSDNILYLKHSSYQSISDSGPSHLSVEKAQNNQILSSDGYYKTRKNQIIRTPLDGAQPLPVSTRNLDTEERHAQNMVKRTSTLQSFKGTLNKSSNSSLVWTLEGAQTISKLTDGQFPCKRATTSWRDMRNSGALLNSRSSLMSRKLNVYRNQSALYKRSTHGLTLRKYKVLALGGCGLKWSKSIERRSKKASEDATRAVVAAETIKREQSRLLHAVSREKNKHHSSRGRIFRIGSVRYRMDPSRKTLRRVVDDGSPPGALEGKGSKRVYVPRRLVIGKNEYIRIGNGNQLIRDPKKRIRMLANEKIRWSLHNVRLRSVKKRRFCQFYTRFGKCNKDDGKCQFIHDSSKIAVCTKFLNGICSDLNCKLTHKIIPERMEDCSYFLQGMCSNENCPYRHVNVNPNAPTCEGFLKGYCADGDECRKKHSYVCHVFEETGSCPQGSKCRFHHPKKRKSKHASSRMHNLSKGRYFGHPALEVSDPPQTVVLMKQSTGSSCSIYQDGDIPDFISLNASGDDDEDNVYGNEEVSWANKHSENDMDIEVCDLDALIKPIMIMNKDNSINLHTRAQSK